MVYCVHKMHDLFRRNRGHGVSSVRRLWQYLVRQPAVQRVFVKCIFSRSAAGAAAWRAHSAAAAAQPLALPESQSYVSRLSAEAAAETASAGYYDQPQSLQAMQLARMQEPVKIIHKEHDAVTAFCINKVSIWRRHSRSKWGALASLMKMLKSRVR